MNDNSILVLISFVVFLASAFIGRKIAETGLAEKEEALKRNWETKRKQLDEEERKLNVKRIHQERDIKVLQQRLEDYQKKLKIAEEMLEEALKHQTDNQSSKDIASSGGVEPYRRDTASGKRIKSLQADLEKYIHSLNKTSWQIGRDYELFVGQKYIAKGYSVDFYGIRKGFEDRGIDLIASNGIQTLFIQCKYWKQGKVLHENVVHQLYGSTIGYCRENNIHIDQAEPVLVTNVTLSQEAKDASNVLGIQVVEHFKLEDFPRIKCCIRKNEDGLIQNIYRLPFDESYDTMMPKYSGERFAWTVQEAEDLGFERK